MRCPHCGIGIKLDEESYTFLDVEDEEAYIFSDVENVENPAAKISVGFCPECKKPIIHLTTGTIDSIDGFTNDYEYSWDETRRIYPIWEKPAVLNEAIPAQYRELYTESEQVNNVSPRASATLSRYLLQMLLHEELHIKKRNLEEELKELEVKANVPSELVAMLQVMRRVANFGAHPKKSTNSNEIVEVEKGEAEVMLGLLAQLFDYLFVKPQQQKEFLQGIEGKYGIKL